ncbi:MAG: hypothetical protein HYV35_00765, partial [Lentisphaerae bacterium]|nr:hypothetical protein [Lentisphaerota bacterium]
MKHNRLSQIALVPIGGLICLLIGALAAAGQDPSPEVAPGQGEIIPTLNAKAKAVDAALDDLRAVLKVAADLQAAFSQETSRKGQTEAQLAEAKAAQAKLAETITALKQKLVDDDDRSKVLKKQIREVEWLRDELAKLRQKRDGVESEIKEVTSTRAQLEQAIGAFNTRLANVQTNLNLLQERAGAIEQVRSELAKEKVAQAAALEQLEKSKKQIAAVEKEKASFQERLAAEEKRLAAGAKQGEQVKQLETELAAIRQARVELQARAAEVAQARSAAEETI